MRLFRLPGLLAALGGMAASAAFGAFPPTAAYPPALEDPVVDGSFTTTNEYRSANRVRDDLNVGWFYKEHRQNWTVNGTTYRNTITFFDTHLFTDKGYGQLDQYDMNSWEIGWGDVSVQIWVFLSGNNPDLWDKYWLDMSGIGLANYPNGFDDDGGFLVRLNYDPSTDRRWKPGDPKPGDPSWDFAKYYGVFAMGGIDSSAYLNGYVNVREKREIYEFSITLNSIPGTGQSFNDGGLPGVPQFGGGLGAPPGPGGGGGGTGADDDEANPPAPDPCSPIWELTVRFVDVKDWKPSMGGWGVIGGPGIIPVFAWVLMGYDTSMHALPEGVEIGPIDAVPIEGQPTGHQ